MAYLVKVTGVANGLVFYAEKYSGAGTIHRSDAQKFGYKQAIEVANLIQGVVGKRAEAEIEPA